MRLRILFSLAFLLAAIVGMQVLRQKKEPAPPSELGAEESPSADVATAPAPRPQTEPSPLPPPKHDRVQRYQELRARLEKARVLRVEAAERESKADIEEPGEELPVRTPLPSLEKDYIQEQMKEIGPLFAECYELALETEPELHGRVVIETKLIGEEGVGGLIESSEVVQEESEIVSPGFLQCVSETMYAVELKAPEGGGEVVIRYPLHFQQSAE